MHYTRIRFSGRGRICRGSGSTPDEPSLGIAGIDASEKLTLPPADSTVAESLSLAHPGYVIRTGRTVLSGTGKELLESDMVRKDYRRDVAARLRIRLPHEPGHMFIIDRSNEELSLS